jgi:hypothetical protein
MDEPKFSRNIHLPPYSHGGSILAAPHGVKARRQAPAAMAQAPTIVPRGGKTIFIFIFKILLTFLKNNKLVSGIITRSYHNQRVDANSLYKIMVKVLLHLNVLVLLRPNSPSVSPSVVPDVRPGVRCPDHSRSELVGKHTLVKSASKG